MESGHGKIRRNVDVDRLSTLPDELIHQILSFISIRQAIEISVLSSRWRFIWTWMPCLNFSSQNLMFHKFASDVLSRRNSQIQVSSVKVGHISEDSFKRILNYIFSHNVQQLTFTWDFKSYWYSGFPFALFNSRSLKHLTLIGGVYGRSLYFPTPTPTPSFELPVLTTLHLHDVTLTPGYIDKGTCLFTNCANLRNLSISRCQITGDVFNIIHPQLSNLTLQYIKGCKAVNVVAPQLKNLMMIRAFGHLMISAPALTSLVMDHLCQLQVISKQGLPSLEKVDLCFNLPIWNQPYLIYPLFEARMLESVLEHLHSVKFLSLNLDILEVVCSPMGLMSHRLSPFANLKMVKFLAGYPTTRVYLEEVSNSTKIKNYHLDGSPSGVFPMVSYEEIRVMRNIVSTRKLIAEFKKQRIQSMESKCDFGGMMVQKLSEIEGLLSELPASKREVMQAAFSSLCDEAAIVTNKYVGSMKIQCNKKPKLLDV